jgi:hypothetical protein
MRCTWYYFSDTERACVFCGRQEIKTSYGWQYNVPASTKNAAKKDGVHPGGAVSGHEAARRSARLAGGLNTSGRKS